MRNKVNITHYFQVQRTLYYHPLEMHSSSSSHITHSTITKLSWLSLLALFVESIKIGDVLRAFLVGCEFFSLSSSAMVALSPESFLWIGEIGVTFSMSSCARGSCLRARLSRFVFELLRYLVIHWECCLLRATHQPLPGYRLSIQVPHSGYQTHFCSVCLMCCHHGPVSPRELLTLPSFPERCRLRFGFALPRFDRPLSREDETTRLRC